jgi:ubiquinone biosynthesis protein UbiJ
MISFNPGSFSAAPASAAINHLLAQEPWARQELQRHAGKIACIDAGSAALRLRVTADGYLEAAPAEDAARVTIRVKLSDLPLIAQNRERAFSYVQIEGDAEFANAISNLSKTLRWEAEHDLEKVMGPIAAVRAVAGAKAAFEAVKTGHQKLAENVAEFLLDEKQVLVRPQTVEAYSAEVTRLRDDVERAAKRLAKLEQKLGSQ